MITVEAVHISPVKSLGLIDRDRVWVGPEGIVEDRRLHLVDQRGELLTQRQAGALARIKADYQSDPERLTLEFADGSTLGGPLELGAPIITNIFGRNVSGRVVLGDWSGSLSDFCQQPVRLVRSDHPGQCYDEYPVTVLSQASVELLGTVAGPDIVVQGNRFRPNFLLSGCEPHEEDTWINDIISIGEELRLRVVSRDPRCAITTLDPSTGERDLDTLRMILSYRPSPVAAYFGVFGIIEHPGAVSLGDEVMTPWAGE